ncbi:CRP/FNR family transcriptional regulator [Paenibacillus rhizosphaerae]|uniref:CRP/FNR family transcriptional regulator n=1 Tax=Paenibacillus rhizosphaerae TaxID=297318 RepID=A0A839TFK1_9BACL|nr:Crp/Fnr family transcriptional regulator [Paenibacillus rhizosphaerae]MBB3125616.1 CRP/FNR family transcriptional regulator [Paenibacillus rhizosphaerae]
MGQTVTGIQAKHRREGLEPLLSQESFERLESIMYKRSVEKGSCLFWEGDPADKLYFIIEGRVRTTKTSDSGRALTLYLHHEGDLVGQMDPFQDSVHSFSAEIMEDAKVGVIQRKDLEALLWQHGDLAVEFMKWMGLMHRLTQTKFRDLMMFGKTGALCSLLIRLGNSYGTEREEGIYIDLRINNSEMADMIGATRESVNRMLSDLKKEDVIETADGHIIIKDLHYLRDICHCENCPKEICRM